MERPKIILKSGKDQSLKRYHPWVFSGAIKKIKGQVEEGDLVDVYDNKDEFLATGHYQVGSIAIRVVSFKQENIDEQFWQLKINNAIRYRKQCGLINTPETNTFRVIHGEGDGIPGLIVDYYNGVAVMQIHSVGIYHAKDQIAKILQEQLDLPVDVIYNKSEGTMPHKAPVEVKDGYLAGTGKKVICKEHGNQFAINWVKGQKTGFFIDQRENRKLVEQYAKEKQVLNMFCYTGGFSVYALRGGASLVHSIDSSQHAIDLTNENVELNFSNTEKHQGIATDAFKYFDQATENYDMIILDPPAFAKHQNVLHNALQGYKRLNIAALENIKPGGILFTFSCSQVVSKENFRKSVFAAAANIGRNVRVMHQLSQPVDHPVNIYHPEGEYLKGLVLQVD